MPFLASSPLSYKWEVLGALVLLLPVLSMGLSRDPRHTRRQRAQPSPGSKDACSGKTPFKGLPVPVPQTADSTHKLVWLGLREQLTRADTEQKTRSHGK